MNFLFFFLSPIFQKKYICSLLQRLFINKTYMKKFFTLLMLIPALFSLAQSSITVTFTAENANGTYCPFDAVEVHNMTQNWSQTLTGTIFSFRVKHIRAITMPRLPLTE